MNKQIAANISVVLSLLLWPVAVLGFAFALASPRYLASAEQIRFAKIIGPGVSLSLALIFLVAAAWLAGYSYSEAKKRALVGTLSCVAFVLVLAVLFLKDAL